MSPDSGERSEALHDLFGSICHQGTVYPASGPAVPFLARAAVAAPGGRAGIGLLLAAMARQYGEDWSDPATFSGAVRGQLAPEFRRLAPLLTDPDPEVRKAMLRVMAVCPASGHNPVIVTARMQRSGAAVSFCRITPRSAVSAGRG